MMESSQSIGTYWFISVVWDIVKSPGLDVLGRDGKMLFSQEGHDYDRRMNTSTGSGGDGKGTYLTC